MSSEPFLKPRLTGERFNGGAIPLDVLADLAVLPEMVLEVAKWRYRQANPGRVRVPAGFSSGFALKLTGVEDGSAIPVIVLAAAISANLSEPYFYNARESILRAVTAADRSEPITPHMPRHLLGYFDRLGRNLADGEAIEFAHSLEAAPARLTKQSRHALILASQAEEVTNEFQAYCCIPGVNQHDRTFNLHLIDGVRIVAPLAPQHREQVLDAVNGYVSGVKARVHLVAVYNRENKLLRVDTVEQITVLDPLDVGYRLEELKQLRNGWLDGVGLAPSAEQLGWFASVFQSHYPMTMPLPHLYPTPEGGVRAEWSLPRGEASLDVDFGTRSGYWHTLDFSSDTDSEETIDLVADSGWARLAELVRAAGGGE